MVQVRDRMIQEMHLRRLSQHTERAYLQAATEFVRFYRRPPAELGEAEVRAYLLHLVDEKKLSPSTHSVHFGALCFRYRHVLGKPEVVAAIPYPKRVRPLPNILSGSEVERLLEALRSPKYKALLMCTYAAGLRIQECCDLKPGDIDSKRMQIKIRCGKGKRDRYVMLSDRLLNLLREYWKIARPKGPFLFPGMKPEKPINRRSVNRVLNKALAAAGPEDRASPIGRGRHARPCGCRSARDLRRDRGDPRLLEEDRAPFSRENRALRAPMTSPPNRDPENYRNEVATLLH